MPNKTYAVEWITFAYKNLATARLLYKANHFEDIIGVDIQQALEKMVKAIYAYENKKIPKEHDLLKLYFVIEDHIVLDDNDLVYLRIATNYYKEDRYPNPNYELPSREEIYEVLQFTEQLFVKVCKLLNIEMKDIVNVR